MIHIVIPVFNRWHFTQPCLDSLLQQTYTDYKIIVVDHGSTDGTSDFIVKDYPLATLLKGDESMWWTAATNVGVKYALKNGADYVLTLNNDLIVESNYLQELYNVSNKYPKALIGSVSVNKSNPFQVVYAGTTWNKVIAKYRSTVDLSKFFEIQKNKKTIRTSLLPGRGTLIPIDAFQSIGLFDELHFPHYAADEDFSLRCKGNGFELFVATKAIVSSVIEETGLKNVHHSNNLRYLKDVFTSIRSPLNLKRRWYWAKKHGSIPIIYFCFDFSRIIKSQFFKR